MKRFMTRTRELRTREKVLLSVLVVGVLGSLATLGLYGAFSATTENAGNEIRTGTVSLTDNDSGAALYNVPNAQPGDSRTQCVRVTYIGSLAANVRLYNPSGATAGPLAPHVNVTITQGTEASSVFPTCQANFTPNGANGGVIYSGTLENLEATHNNYATGITTLPAGETSWDANSALVYRVQATLSATTPNELQNTSTGVHSFVWEARNQ